VRDIGTGGGGDGGDDTRWFKTKMRTNLTPSPPHSDSCTIILPSLELEVRMRMRKRRRRIVATFLASTVCTRN